MHAGVTNIQRLAAAESSCFLIRRSAFDPSRRDRTSLPPTLNRTVSHTRELP
jgi:hypothetical protein